MVDLFLSVLGFPRFIFRFLGSVCDSTNIKWILFRYPFWDLLLVVSLIWNKKKSKVVFICISLITRNKEHILKRYLLAIFFLCLRILYSGPMLIFQMGYWWVRIGYEFSLIYIAGRYSLPFCELLFYLVDCFFSCVESFNFTEFHSSVTGGQAIDIGENFLNSTPSIM